LIKQKEFAKRRTQLMRMAGDDSIIIVRAAPARFRNSDVHYPYRQDSDFLYLTGFHEPDALLVLIPGGDNGRCILFCRERDPEREMWDGPMTGLRGAVADYGMDEAFAHEDIAKRLPGMLHNRDRIYYDLGRAPIFVTSHAKPSTRPKKFTHWTTCCMICVCTKAAKSWPP
jgi:Xaa-Pro aminopeptidase